MTHDPKEGARVLRIIGKRPPREDAEPIASAEALASLAGDLARFENAAKTGSQDPAAPTPQVSTLAAMSSKTSPLSVKRENPASDPAVPATPFPKKRRAKTDPV